VDKKMKRSITKYLISVAFVAALTGCSGNPDNANTTATTSVTPPPVQRLQLAGTPQKILDEKQKRGEQEEAKPELHIISPTEGAVIDGSVVRVRLHLAGDLKGYAPHKDPATGQGNHIHVILDNEPYEAYYDLDQPFELRNVVPGQHTLRVFPSRAWHESYKNDGAFQMVTFTVKGSVDRATAHVREVDPGGPLLTYSRPKGEYKDADADPIMIDFWLSNARLRGDGGEYRMRYIVDDDEPRYIDKWEPVWLSGWMPGKHTVRLELLGPDNWPVKNGDLNVTTREITVVK
jgi:hypothetical protein